MNYSKDETNRLLEKLERHLEKDTDFSTSDMAALDEMLKAWKGWVALGRGAKWLITALGLIAAGIASWSVLASSIKDWLTS